MPSVSQPQSHREAADLFSRAPVVQGYVRKAAVEEHTTASFVFARRREIVLALLDAVPQSGTLVDYGMGPAVYGAEVVRRGFHYVGIDIATGMVEYARSLNLANAEFVNGDLEALAQFRGQADVLMAIGLIDYLEDPHDGIRRLVECLKPGGTLLVSFRNRRSLVNIMRDAARVVWRKLLGGVKWRQNSAFTSAVTDRTFSYGSDLRPRLTALGCDEFRVRYLNFSPMFFSISMPRFIWRFWVACDRLLAGRFTRWSCSAGVISATKAR